MELEKLDLPQFVERMSQLIDLPISPDAKPAVVENLKKIAELATFVMEFSLPESIEIAPKFEP